MGVTDPLSLADYEAHEGWAGLRARAATRRPRRSCSRCSTPACAGAAARPSRPASSGRPCCRPPAAQKYVVCNADEGDSGTFSDRMTDGGRPVHADRGHGHRRRWRSARRRATSTSAPSTRTRSPRMNEAIARATAAGFLGDSVCGSGRAFHLQVRKAAGAYVCGEETAMLESIEGKRGIVRAKPPLPAHRRACSASPPSSTTSSAWPACRSSWRAARRSTATSAWAARAARCRSSWPATSSTAAWSRRPSALTLRELLYDFGGGTPQRPADQGGAGGRPAGRLCARVAVGPAAGLRGLCRHRRGGGPRRHRGARRHGRHGQAGALRDGVLRARDLRQVHALPHRLDARRRGHRPHHRPTRTGRSRSSCCATCATPCCTARCARWAA